MASTISYHDATTLITMMLMITTMFYFVNAQAPMTGPVQSPITVAGPVQPPTAMSGLAPGPAAEDCLTVLYGMADCLTYVEKDSNQTKPDPNCCPELSTVVKNHPLCLCLLLGNTSFLGVEIDISKALQLPTTCKVSVPDLSNCPATSPAAAPAETPGAPDLPASSPGIGGSALGPDVAASPGSGGGNNGAPATRAAFGFTLVVTLTAFFCF